MAENHAVLRFPEVVSGTGLPLDVKPELQNFFRFIIRKSETRQ
jgi:hypothetical protein